LSDWYFQVREPREIRDFILTLNLPDLPKGKLDYPEDCMTPTQIEPANDSLGCALTGKGMGIALPKLPQPGAATRAVLGEADDAWQLVFAVLVLAWSTSARSVVARENLRRFVKPGGGSVAMHTVETAG
jgi:hypothetical protein